MRGKNILNVRVWGLALYFVMLAGAASAQHDGLELSYNPCDVVYGNEYVHTTINERTGELTANGRLFYPKLIWSNTNQQYMKDAARIGFNAVHPGHAFYYQSTVSEGIASGIALLDKAKNAGMYALLAFGPTQTRNLDLLAQYIKGIKHHPALLAVSFPDEGTSSSAGALTKPEMIAAYQTIKSIAPDLLVVFDHYGPVNISYENLGEVSDVFALQFYPYWDGNGGKGLNTKRFLIKGLSRLEQLERKSLPGSRLKTLWMIAQGFTDSGHMTPTKEDFAFQFWAGVIYSAKAGYQNYKWPSTSSYQGIDSGMQADVSRFISEDIDANAEWLLRAQERRDLVTLQAQTNTYLLRVPENESYQGVVATVPYVDYSAFHYNNDLYVIVYNRGKPYSTDDTLGGISIVVEGASNQSVQVISANNGPSTYPLQDGKMALGTLQPFDYRVLKVDLHTPTTTNRPPVALGGDDLVVTEGSASIMLDGAASSDPDADTLTYQWDQIAGPTVPILNRTRAVASVDIPLVAGEISLTFRLSVSDGELTDTDTVMITIRPREIARYTLISTAQPGGIVAPQGTVTVEEGTDQTVRITPDPGYQIQNVVVDGRSQGPLTSYTWNDIREDHTIIAFFTERSKTSYFGYDDFGGTWHDARQTSSDYLAWAAAAANMLEWTGWGTAEHDTAQDIFSHFEDHWTDDAGTIGAGWNWWVDGTLPSSQDSRSQVDTSETGSFWPQEDFASLFHESRADVAEGHVSEGAHLMEAVDTYLHDGYGVTVDTYQNGERHALAVWGYEFDEASNYTGLWVTDSTDSSDDGLVFLAVNLVGGLWHLEPKTREGSQPWVLGGVQALERYEPVPEPGTLALVGIGLIGGLVLRRKSRRSKRA